MESRAEILFKEITTNEDKVSFLTQMAEKHAKESEFLEFKGGKIEGGGLRSYWSQALSGFANTEGGVLIFGIDARPTPVDKYGTNFKIDHADSVAYVPHAESFAQNLKNQILESVQDPLGGVEVLPVVADQNTGGGFVVCYVPEGKSKPYRAKLEKNEPYCMRIDTNFVTIPHSFMRSLFLPQLRSNISCNGEVAGSIRTGRTILRFKLNFRNDGPATAQDMVVKVYVNQDGVDGGHADIWSPANESRLIEGFNTAFAMQALRPVHPQDADRYFFFTWDTGHFPSIEDSGQVNYVRMHKPFVILISAHMFNQPAQYFMKIFDTVIARIDSFTMTPLDFERWRDIAQRASAIR